VDGNAMFGFILILLIAVAYFLPIWVAAARNCKAGAGIAVVNLFLGWTFIGWVVALAWAASGEQKPKELPAAPVLESEANPNGRWIARDPGIGS
jgi:hypothetical protein